MNEPKYPDKDNTLGGSRKAANVPDEATYPITNEEFLCLTDASDRDDRLRGLSGICLSCGISMLVALSVHLFTASWVIQSESTTTLKISTLVVAIIYGGIGFGGIIGYALRKEPKNNSYSRLKEKIQSHFSSYMDALAMNTTQPNEEGEKNNDQ